MRKGEIVEWDGDYDLNPWYHTGKIEAGGGREIVVRWDMIDGRKIDNPSYSMAFTKRKDGSWKPLGSRKANSLARM